MQTRFLSTSALLPLVVGLAVTVPVLPAPAQGMRLAAPAGGFSYLPPPGWHVRPFPGLKYKISYAKPENGFAPNISVLDEVAAVSLEKFMQINLAGMKRTYANFTVLSQRPFVTASGIPGIRLAVNGTTQGRTLHQVFYIFPASNNRKLVAAASFPASDGIKYDAVTDKAMKTFKLQ